MGMLAIVQAPVAKAASIKQIAMKNFFKNTEKARFRISPDGKYFSYSSDYKGKINIFVHKTGESKAVRVIKDILRSINSYFWKRDHTLYQQDVVWTGNDRLYGEYYIYEITSRATVKIANSYPWFNEKELASRKPDTFTTRDGLINDGYLTLPNGMAAVNLPVFINSHYGPWARDVWG